MRPNQYTATRQFDRSPMIRAIRSHWAQIAMIVAVFAVFLANAAGVFEVFFDVETSSGTLSSISRSKEFFVLTAIGLGLSVLLPILSPIHASVLILLATFPIFYLGYTNTSIQPLVPMEYSLLTILMLFVVNVVTKYFREPHEKQELISVFGQYVPPEVVAIIKSDPKGFAMEGEAREMSVMFCDVHNFTSISEQLEPKQLALLLNTLFTPLTEILYKHKGVIDKYMGDAIMAFWGHQFTTPHTLATPSRRRSKYKKNWFACAWISPRRAGRKSSWASVSIPAS